ITSVAEVLELHMRALDRKDPAAAREYEAYATLVKEHRAIGAQLQATAQRMAGYRDLPMGRHDEKVMSDPKAFAACERFVSIGQELVELRNFANRDFCSACCAQGAGSAEGFSSTRGAFAARTSVRRDTSSTLISGDGSAASCCCASLPNFSAIRTTPRTSTGSSALRSDSYFWTMSS